MTTGSLSEYMVRKSDEFNVRVDIVEQKLAIWMKNLARWSIM